MLSMRNFTKTSLALLAGLTASLALPVRTGRRSKV